MPEELVPPDGGWGWFIVIAYSLSVICTVSIIQGFGLLFGTICADLGMSATEISLIISVNSAFGMGLGLVNGPLLRYFGYRRVAIAGTIFHGMGLILSAWASSFTHLIITYGILCSLGYSITNSAFSLALNSYFMKYRNRAVGLAMTMNGVGPIFAPQLISFLLTHYGARGTIMIIGAISLHMLAGAFLLQPLRWHLKKVETAPDAEETSQNEAEDKRTGNEGIAVSCEDLGANKRQRTMTMSSMDHDVNTGSIYGHESMVMGQTSTTTYVSVALADEKTYKRNNSLCDTTQTTPDTPTDRQWPIYEWWSSGKSLDTINLGSSIGIFDESRLQKSARSNENFKDGIKSSERRPSEARALMQKSIQIVEEEEEDGTGKEDQHDNPKEEEKPKSRLQRMLHTIVVFFDFDLLRDPIYVNTMMGMSIAIFAELNFSVLTPFILDEIGLVRQQITTVMSSLAITDLIVRGLAPYIGECLKQSARIMYLISLVLLVITRTSLIFATNFTSAMLVGFALGVAKGIRSVYLPLVISSYVPIEKLASASGIQMVTNGIILMAIGPLLGMIRDTSGSYKFSIVFMNMLTLLTIVLWTIEIIIRIFKSKLSKSTNNGEQKKGKTNSE